MKYQTVPWLDSLCLSFYSCLLELRITPFLDRKRIDVVPLDPFLVVRVQAIIIYKYPTYSSYNSVNCKKSHFSSCQVMPQKFIIKPAAYISVCSITICNSSFPG